MASRGTALPVPPTPRQIYSLCPAGTEARSVKSSGIIGTAYGKFLGLICMLERKPRPYGVVDGAVFRAGAFLPAPFASLGKIDPLVAGALATGEWSTGFMGAALRKRTDILDAQRCEVYEIKPLGSRDEGPPQLERYIKWLNKFAATTPSGKARLWKGGMWDPSRYPLIIPSTLGNISIIYAWRDPEVQGLLVYNILECVPNEENAGDQPVLASTKIKSWDPHLNNIRPVIEQQLTLTLPRAPIGKSYAVLVTWRFFQSFILPQWEAEQDRLLRRAYEIPVKPALAALVLETFVLAHVLTGPVADAAAVWTGFLSAREVLQLWGYAAVGGAVCVLVALCIPQPELVAGVAAAVEEAGIVDGATTAGLETEALAEPPMVESPDDVVDGPWSNGLDPEPPWLDDYSRVGPGMFSAMLPPVAASQATGIPQGLGMLGVTYVGAVSTTPEAAEAGTETGQVSPTAIGADPIHIAPVELLTSPSGKIGMAAKVEYAGQAYVVVGMVKAEL